MMFVDTINCLEICFKRFFFILLFSTTVCEILDRRYLIGNTHDNSFVSRISYLTKMCLCYYNDKLLDLCQVKINTQLIINKDPV